VHAALPQLLPLICPACRRRTERGRELFTLSLCEVVESDPQGEVEAGLLGCDNPACQKRYPIIAGIPILLPPAPAAISATTGVALPGVGGTVSGQLAALAALPPEIAALLAVDGPDDAALPRLLEHLSIYLDAHWGDRATPPPAGPAAGWGGRQILGAIAARAGAKVERAVELGCSVGRGLLELARGAELVVGVDLHLGALLAARRLLRGEPLRYARRVIGRHYAPARIEPPPGLGQRVALLCGDALDPPLVPQDFARVAACNLLDSVQSPAGLLSVMDGLCEPGGEILLMSPYAWQSGVVGETERIGGADPGAVLRAMLASGGIGLFAGLEAPYTLEEDRELLWELRRDSRSAHSYLVHYLRGRKALTASPPPPSPG
jgi:SAM-dependent methyltransferase/uncharacterized protein YbaR (Trm112 family)